MEIIQIDPTQVRVREGLDRYRQDMGDVEKLADSIERTRQILPIIVTRQFELIDGGRRLAACLLRNIKVKAIFEDVVDDYEYRELEIEANLHRKDFTPAEEALAIRDLHNLKQDRLGTGGQGTTDGWTIAKTAELLGKTRGTVYNALEMATLIDAFPELRNAKKKNEIKKAGKALQKLSLAIDGAKKYEEAIRDNRLFELHHKDSVEHMEILPSGSIDILLTDPLYGIGADLITKTIGGGVGKGFSTTGFKIEDEQEAAYFYYYVLAQQSYRFCSEAAHGYVFVGPEHFWKVRQIFLNAKWLVHIKPLIWIKRTTGQCNIPSSWPSSCYEMLMYIRKENSRLIKEGMPDWLECNPVLPSERIHPYEKPVPLLIELLERVSLPGQVMIDPFAGSCASIEAGVKMKLYSIGVEIDNNAYSFGVKRMGELK
jgi:ParB/RepB/Spo0J family partition protein